MKELFSPRSIAVIGAAREPSKIGNVVFRNLLAKFKGSVFPVNPNADEVLGRKCFSSVRAIPGKVDLAVVAVPAALVPRVLEDCGKKRVPAAVVISSGFSEVGNKTLENRVARIARHYGIGLVGPNCLGVFDSASGVDTLFLPEEKLKRPKGGGVAFISQSGAVGSIVLDWLASEGFGVSKFVSYGNAAGLTESDFIEYFARDAGTRVICLYLEGVKDGKRLLELGKRVCAHKPVLVIKGGWTQEGTSAVASHTGSLAGSDAAYSAAFKQAGMIRVYDVKDMFEFAEALATQPAPKSKRIAIVTNGGGFGVLATDEAVSQGLEMPEFSPQVKRVLRKLLPPYVNVHNPLDLAGDANPARYKQALDALLKDARIDGVLCITLMQTFAMDESVVNAVAGFAQKKKKPIVVCTAGGDYVQRVVKEYEERGVPVFDSPATAAKALWCLAEYGRIKRKFS